MRVVTVKMTLYAPWVHSLKEKRSEVKSLIRKLQSRFNASVAEVDRQDVHQTMVIGVAAIALTSRQAESAAEGIVRFVEGSTQAEVVQVERDWI